MAISNFVILEIITKTFPCTKLSYYKFSNCAPGGIKMRGMNTTGGAQVSEEGCLQSRLCASLPKSTFRAGPWEHLHRRKQQTSKSGFPGERLVKQLPANPWSRSDFTCIYRECLCKIQLLKKVLWVAKFENHASVGYFLPFRVKYRVNIII